MGITPDYFEPEGQSEWRRRGQKQRRIQTFILVMRWACGLLCIVIGVGGFWLHQTFPVYRVLLGWPINFIGVVLLTSVFWAMVFPLPFMKRHGN